MPKGQLSPGFSNHPLLPGPFKKTEALTVASYELLNAIQGLDTVPASKSVFSFSPHYATINWLQSYCRPNGIEAWLVYTHKRYQESAAQLLLLVVHLLPQTERKILLQFSHPVPEQIMFEMENLEVRIQRTEVEGIYTGLGGVGLEEGRCLLSGVVSQSQGRGLFLKSL